MRRVAGLTDWKKLQSTNLAKANGEKGTENSSLVLGSYQDGTEGQRGSL